MPARASELERAARELGFVKTRQKGSHARWQHPDGRSTTIPIHPSREIGGWLFRNILGQLGVTEEDPREVTDRITFSKIAPERQVSLSVTREATLLASGPTPVDEL